MLANEPYLSADPELRDMRLRARQLTKRYNNSEPEQYDVRQELLTELLAKLGTGCEIEPPFYCDYGSNIELGNNVFINFGCVILDCSYVRSGNNVMIGPNVQLLCAYHPVDATERNSGYELAAPITLGDNVWLGGGVIVCPNVTVGANTVIGAGSVVTRNIEPNVVAAGNPCRVIRQL